VLLKNGDGGGGRCIATPRRVPEPRFLAAYSLRFRVGLLMERTRGRGQ
jgi:hypothetical protein